jgi:pre-mRNA-splicing factor RBM22/SLT11
MLGESAIAGINAHSGKYFWLLLTSALRAPNYLLLHVLVISHEMPTDKKDPLAKQNIRDRFFGNNDPVANKILNGGGSSAAPLQPPADPGIKTLWVGGLTEVLGQEELKAALESFGEIQSVRLIATKGCAFIEFQDRSGAEKAARILNGNMNVKGIPLRLRWAMGERIDQPGLRNMGSTESFPSTGYVLPPPPGIAQGQSVPVMPQLKGYNPPPRPASNSLAPQSGYLPVPGPSTLTPVRRVHGTARQAVAPYPSQNPLRMGSKPRAGAEVEK